MRFACRMSAEVTPLAMSASRPATRIPSIAESSALDLTLRALRPFFNNPDVTELCINRPGEGFLETREGWICQPLDFATFDWCLSLAKLVANSTRQRIDAETPL